MPIKWKKVWISDETFESAEVIDVDGNGIPDIVSGGFWYEGPDFRKKHDIYTAKQYGEYFDDFSTISMDVNGDGRPDVITGGWWGNTLRWLENPGDPAKKWTEHIIDMTGNVETTRAWDVDNDGMLEIVPNTPCSNEVKIYKLITDKNGKGTGKFKKHVIYTFKKGEIQEHGLGCGDIAGNGRMDIVLRKGWLEAPKDTFKGKWIWHPEFDLDRASIPVLVADINGDGKSELIYGNGHGYGLYWMEYSKKNGKRVWKRHTIDPHNAQYHDMQWVDIDGDGKKELLTGKRHRAHCGNEDGEWDDMGTYYFKWDGEGFSKQVVDYGPIGEGKGLGIYFATADLRGTGRLDIVAPGKDGLYVFYNEGL